METGVSALTTEYRANLECYIASMLQAKRMLGQGILTSADYADVENVIAKKYGIPKHSLYREIDLINGGSDGNMSH